MQILLDDKLVDPSFADGTTLEDTLRHLQTNLCTSNQVVVGLRCDGEEVPADTMSQRLMEQADQYDHIQVITCTRASLVADALTQATRTLEDTHTQMEQVANMLTEGKTSEGMESLGGCLRAWQHIHQAVSQSVDMLGLDTAQITVKDVPFSELFAKPKEVLLQVKAALEAQDHVLLADILQYELSDVTDQWYAVITLLQQEATNADASAT